MKKLLALLLAVTMLASTVAFAADLQIGEGTEHTCNVMFVEPNTTIRIYASEFLIDEAIEQFYFNAGNSIAAAGIPLTNEYFAISAKKFSRGAELIKSVSINDEDECVEIVLNDADIYTNLTNLRLNALKDDNGDLSLNPSGIGSYLLKYGYFLQWMEDPNLVIKELTLKLKKKYELEDSQPDPIVLKKGTEFRFWLDEEAQDDLADGYEKLLLENPDNNDDLPESFPTFEGFVVGYALFELPLLLNNSENAEELFDLLADEGFIGPDMMPNFMSLTDLQTLWLNVLRGVYNDLGVESGDDIDDVLENILTDHLSFKFISLGDFEALGYNIVDVIEKGPSGRRSINVSDYVPVNGVYQDIELSLVDGNLIFGPAYGSLRSPISGRSNEIVRFSGRVYKDDILDFKFNMDPDLDLVKKYPDAELTFINLGGVLTTATDIEVYGDEDQYLYEIKDGKLVPSALKWDDDAYAFIGETVSLGSYVLSDVNLEEDLTVANPETGIPTAAALLALAAAI